MQERPIEPVSWLRLERYHLGELSAEQAAEVEAALAVDPETRACLEEIRRPMALRPLPEPPGRGAVVKLRRAVSARWPVLSLAALAAGIALLVWSRSMPLEMKTPSRSIRVKGGDLVLSLVREREGAIDSAPTTFAEGDRFKVLVTCPPTFDGTFDVVVLQNGVPSFPFADATALVCGNSVPVPGAFMLTGAAPASVCVTWARGLGVRQRIEREGPETLRDSAACVTLTPE